MRAVGLALALALVVVVAVAAAAAAAASVGTNAMSPKSIVHILQQLPHGARTCVCVGYLYGCVFIHSRRNIHVPTWLRHKMYEYAHLTVPYTELTQRARASMRAPACLILTVFYT